MYLSGTKHTENKVQCMANPLRYEQEYHQIEQECRLVHHPEVQLYSNLTSDAISCQSVLLMNALRHDVVCTPYVGSAVTVRMRTTYTFRSRKNPQYVKLQARIARTTQIQAQIPNGRSQATHSVTPGCVGLFIRVPANPRTMEMTTIYDTFSFFRMHA